MIGTHFLEINLKDEFDCKGCLLLEERETTSEYKWGCLLNRQDKIYQESILADNQEEFKFSYCRDSTYRGDACPLHDAVSFKKIHKNIKSCREALEKLSEVSCGLLSDIEGSLDVGHDNGCYEDFADRSR